MPKQHLILVGPPGSGKTTAGRLLAAHLDAPFVDLDRFIEAKTGRTIEKIFTEQGESAFRDIESEVGKAVLAGAPSVVVPGAGYFIRPDQRDAALAIGFVVYLKVSPTEAARRLEGLGNRPLLQGFEPVLRLAQILRQREASYLLAPHKVDTDKLTAEQVAERLAKLARSEAGW